MKKEPHLIKVDGKLFYEMAEFLIEKDAKDTDEYGDVLIRVQNAQQYAFGKATEYRPRYKERGTGDLLMFWMNVYEVLQDVHISKEPMQAESDELEINETRIADQDMECGACEWFKNNDIDISGFTKSKQKNVRKAEKNGFKILKGEKYLYQKTTNEDGDEFEFTAIRAIHEICGKYGIYQYD